MRDNRVFWAITSRDGFYTGTWLTRRDAIQAHYDIAGMVSEAKEAFWKRRRKAYGDRAAKVQLREVR